MTTSEAKRLKELEKENLRLKRLLGDLSLDNAIRADLASGKILSPQKEESSFGKSKIIILFRNENLSDTATRSKNLSLSSVKKKG